MRKGRAKKGERGASTIGIALAIGAVVVGLGLAVLMSTDTQIRLSFLDQKRMDSDWAVRAAVKLVEDSWRAYISPNSGNELFKAIDYYARDSSLYAAMNRGDALRVFEYTQCSDDSKLPTTLPTSLPYRVDLSDPDRIMPCWQYNSTDKTITYNNTPIWNNIDSNSGRQFDALITVETDGQKTETYNPCHYTSNNSMYVFPIRFTITLRVRVAGEKGSMIERTVTGKGSFAFYISRKSFSEYLMFANQFYQSTPGDISLTNNITYEGPIHTNTHFRFTGNPSATLKDKVTQHDTYADFNGKSYTGTEPLPYNGVKPIFEDDFVLGVPTIDLPPNLLGDFKGTVLGSRQESAMVNGVNLPLDGTKIVTGGVYIKGNVKAFELSRGDGTQTYKITMASAYTGYDNVYTITSDYKTNTTLYTTELWSKSGTNYIKTTTNDSYTGILDASKAIDDPGNQAAFYVAGNIGNYGSNPTGLRGDIAKDTELSICASGNITIVGNIKYEVSPNDPNIYSAKNMLGLMSEASIYIDQPNAERSSMEIHASLMIPYGILTAYDYNTVLATPKPTVTLYGGVVQNRYGPMGSGTDKGYKRDFKYDPRLKFDPPPLYPKQDSYKYQTENEYGTDTMKLVWKY